MARRHPKLLLALLGATALSAAAQAEPLSPDVVKIDSERLRPGVYPAAPVPEDFAVPPEPGHPLFDVDWSVGLKGSYTFEGGDSDFVSAINPQFTATYDGLRANLTVDGSATIERPWEDEEDITITSGRLGVSAVAPIDSLTTASANGGVTLSQESRTALALDPIVVVAPQVLSADLGLGVDRSFGRFNLALGATAQRTVYGPSRHSATGESDNSAQNLWALDSSLRLGFEATPIIGVFAEASAGRNYFDDGANDATDLALRGGISGSWNGTLAASASIGRGYQYFDDADLGDVATQLYDASITFTPNSTISLTAALNTSIDPVGADAEGRARVSHTASADLGYTVNSWLRLRASADWGMSELVGANETEYLYGVGAGADYRLNSQTALSADYGYRNRDSSADGRREAHTISLGVTLQR